MNGTASDRLGRASTAFALAAAIACIFNMLLAWAKDAWAPLTSIMTSLTGHHWITHGLADLVVFFSAGAILMNNPVSAAIDPGRLRAILIWSVVAAGAGLFAWYLFF